MPRHPIIPILVTATSLALTACAPGEDDAESDPEAATEAVPAAADGTDVDACFDGECEVLVTGPVAIPLDPDLPPKTTVLSVTEFDESTVTLEFGPAETSQSLLDPTESFDVSANTYFGGGRDSIEYEATVFDGEQMILLISLAS